VTVGSPWRHQRPTDTDSTARGAPRTAEGPSNVIVHSKLTGASRVAAELRFAPCPRSALRPPLDAPLSLPVVIRTSEGATSFPIRSIHRKSRRFASLSSASGVGERWIPRTRTLTANGLQVEHQNRVPTIDPRVLHLWPKRAFWYPSRESKLFVLFDGYTRRPTYSERPS
jgi:hypothetical protein